VPGMLLPDNKAEGSVSDAMRDTWAEESGLHVRFEKVSAGIRISIGDIAKGTLGSATVTPWRWDQIVDAFPASDPCDPLDG
jgi:hypothetical protein